GDVLVDVSQQIAKAKAGGGLRMNPLADLVRHEGQVVSRAPDDLAERDRVVLDGAIGVAAQLSVGDPEREAIADDAGPAPRELAKARGQVEGLLHRGPVARTLGAMTRDARRHVGITGLRRGDEHDARVPGMMRERKAALAAASAAQDEE